MENNNDAQEVKHAPKDFSGDYLQRPCSKSFARRGWNIHAQTSLFPLLLIARRFCLGESPPCKTNKQLKTNKQKKAITML